MSIHTLIATDLKPEQFPEFDQPDPAGELATEADALLPDRPSDWSISPGKRLFDIVSVLLALPFILPVLAFSAILVRCTSRGPVLFLQKRIGRHGRPFTIFKFRTMEHLVRGSHHAVTAAGNQRFTPVGPFLRRWKLDEMPQLFNVLAGHMSLVGPRPKLPEHRVAELRCRPGVTGAATLAFAREEAYFARLPKQQLDEFYRSLVLPTKHNLDAAYMGSASFRSDFKVLLDTALRRWNCEVIEQILAPHAPGRDPSSRMANVYQFEHSAPRDEREPVAAVAPQD